MWKYLKRAGNKVGIWQLIIEKGQLKLLTPHKVFYQ